MILTMLLSVPLGRRLPFDVTALHHTRPRPYRVGEQPTR